MYRNHIISLLVVFLLSSAFLCSASTEVKEVAVEKGNEGTCTGDSCKQSQSGEFGYSAQDEITLGSVKRAADEAEDGWLRAKLMELAIEYHEITERYDMIASRLAGGYCYSSRGCAGKKIGYKDCHNCKNVGGKSVEFSDGKCQNC